MQGLNLTEIVDDIAGSGGPGGFAWNRTLPPSAAFLPPAAESGRQQQVLDCLVQEGRAIGQAAPQFALAALQALLNTKGWVLQPSDTWLLGWQGTLQDSEALECALC